MKFGFEIPYSCPPTLRPRRNALMMRAFQLVVDLAERQVRWDSVVQCSSTSILLGMLAIRPSIIIIRHSRSGWPFTRSAHAVFDSCAAFLQFQFANFGAPGGSLALLHPLTGVQMHAYGDVAASRDAAANIRSDTKSQPPCQPALTDLRSYFTLTIP